MEKLAASAGVGHGSRRDDGRAGGGEIVWTTADNQRVPLTVEDFAEINSMAAYRSNSLHIKYNELKVEVNEAQTVEEVNEIMWE